MSSISILPRPIISYHDTKRIADLGEKVINGYLERVLHFGRDTVARLVNSRLKEGLYPKARSSWSSLFALSNGFSSIIDSDM